jgi:type IV pilus assembly protein PilV
MGKLIPRYIMRASNGFTLIEVLISIIVLSIGMLGLSRITVATINANSSNKRHTIASTLVQDRMESVKKSGYAGATNTSYTEGYNTITNYAAYKRVTTITLNSPAANMRTVTVTVFWQNDKHSLSATTILAE